MLLFKELWRQWFGKEEPVTPPVLQLAPKPDISIKPIYVCTFPNDGKFAVPICTQCGQQQGRQDRKICIQTYNERQLVTDYHNGSAPQERWEEAKLLIRSGVKPFETA